VLPAKHERLPGGTVRQRAHYWRHFNQIGASRGKVQKMHGY
jgi:hypothetical protein